jgi:hypothetical protein
MQNHNRTRSAVIGTCLSSLLLLFSSPSKADTIAYTFTGGFLSVAAPVTAGIRFSPNENIVVTEVGVFDSRSPGLVDSHDIGLWTDTGTLLASTTVPAGTGSPLIEGFHFVAISPVLLTGGDTYRLGAFYPTFSDAHISNVTFTTASEIVLDQSSYAGHGIGGSLTFPARPGNAGGDATVNFFFRPVNAPPDCSGAEADPDLIWPPDHKFADLSVVGVTDPDGDPITITITAIAQDEPLEGLGDGNTCPDGLGVGTDVASVRAERSGTRKVPGDGRVYHIDFNADDGQGGSCDGIVAVCVPHDQRLEHVCVDQGPIFDSTVCGSP